MRSQGFFAHSPESVVFVLSCLAVLTWTGGSFGSESPSERACATVEPTAAEAQAIQLELERDAGGSATQSGYGGVVRVAFHILHNGVDGNVTDAQIEAQMGELNADFSGAAGGYDTGYRFVLASIDRTLNPEWFDLVQGSKTEKNVKEALAVDPVHTINIYTARFNALGWSTFPWSIPEDEVHQGIVVHYGSLPGGYIENFNMGRTVTHEVGHYFGLMHTFFGGCQEPNDFVTDTPALTAQTTGCPPGRHRYVQSARRRSHPQFPRLLLRPLLRGVHAGSGRPDGRHDLQLEAEPHHFRAGVGNPPLRKIATLRPVFPNPAVGRATVSFSLRQESRVSLRVVDLTGRVVAHLVEGVLPAGSTRGFSRPESEEAVSISPSCPPPASAFLDAWS
jgi:hypothetical protein